MCICIWMVVFVCVYLYAYMNACTHALVAFHLMFFFSMLICVFAIVISQARKIILVFRKPHGKLMMAVLSLGRTIPRSIRVMLHCEASCEEYCCNNMICLSLHCLGMYSSCDLGGCWALVFIHCGTFCPYFKWKKNNGLFIRAHNKYSCTMCGDGDVELMDIFIKDSCD